MKKIFCFLLLLVLAAWPVAAEKIVLPLFPRYTRSEIEALKFPGGQPLWKEIYTFTTGMAEGKKFLLIDVNGEGKYGGSSVSTRWKVVNYYYADPYIQPYYSKKQVFSSEGKLIETQNIFFDQNSRKIYFNRENMISKQKKNKTLELKDDVLDRYIYGAALQSYPFSEKRELSFHYLTDDPNLFKLTFSYAGKEKVALSFGSFDAYKLKLQVDLGALNLMSGFFPDNFFWITDNNPPMFIKYQGLESGLGSPMVIMRLTGMPKF